MGEEPLVFTIGQNEVIDGFESSIKEMTIGEKKTVVLAPEQAYGERYDDLIVEESLSDMPDDLELELGDELEITTEDDEPMLVIVAAISDKTVTLDGNAPLAGEHLTFELSYNFV